LTATFMTLATVFQRTVNLFLSNVTSIHIIKITT
jgi:hypothetical protein